MWEISHRIGQSKTAGGKKETGMPGIQVCVIVPVYLS